MNAHGPLPTFESFLTRRTDESKRFKDKWEKLEFFTEDVERVAQSLEEKYGERFQANYDENTDSIELVLIEVSEESRGQGLASKMMDEFCRYADEHGMIVRLHANDELGTSLEVLMKFYKKHGFVDKRKFVAGAGQLMIRSPK